MIKLSFAAALLLGVNAVNTDSKAKSTLLTSQGEQSRVDYLMDVTQLPAPSDADVERTRTYWADNERCLDLFETIIRTRRTITDTITDYHAAVETYNRECKYCSTILINDYR